MKRTLYAAWPQTARRTWGWAAILLTLAGFGLSSLIVIAGSAVYGAVLAVGGAGPDEIQRRMMGDTLTFLLPLLLVQFILWAGLTIAWVKLFENRPLATIGLGPGAAPRYLVGLLLGVILVLAVGLAALALGAAPDATDPPDLPAALPPAGAIIAVLLGCSVFLVQGAAEEIVFRGWLMSTLAARWGAGPAVIVSGLLFAVLHLHVFASGVVFGSLVLTGIGITGLVFAVLCVERRSAIEAISAIATARKSAASAIGAPWKLPPESTSSSSGNTSGLSVAAFISIASRASTSASTSRAAPCTCGAQRMQ